jgi:hypothetical protein
MTDETAAKAEAIKALEKPGSRRIKLKADMRQVDAELKPLVADALRADVPIRMVSKMTGLSLNTVLLWGSR